MTARDSLPPLSCLSSFEAAARLRSFTRAGQELYLSQSAISRQVKQLESDLGRPLFERYPDGLRPTPAGEHYFTVVQRVLKELGEESASLRRRGKERQLTIASSPTIASIWLARKLPDFQLAYPEIDIRILTMEDPARLDSSEFDCGLYYHVPDEFSLKGMSVWPVFEQEQVAALCSPHYLEQHGAITCPADLLDNHTLMIVEDHHHDWLTWQTWFEALNEPWQPPQKSVRANSFQLLTNATLAGQGVTLGWVCLMEEEIRQGNIVQALPQTVPSRGRLSLMVPAYRHLSDAAGRFQQWLLSDT